MAANVKQSALKHRLIRKQHPYAKLTMKEFIEDIEEVELNTLDSQLLLPSHGVEDVKTYIPEESTCTTSTQLIIPFLLAGFGMVAASLLLDIVQHWPVYQQVSEVYILVPALLGLKGNLEMTLASRLSTHANLGHMDSRKEKLSLVLGNLSLIQCQAVVVGFLASFAAVILGWVPRGEFNIQHGFLLCASSIVTASGASFILGLIMIAVILLSKRFHINPDNVSTPIAASLGDLTTLAFLSWLASLLHSTMHTMSWVPPVIIVAGAVTIPLWAWLASRNEYTRQVLYSGWVPVISAMIISSLGGLILDYTVSRFKGIAVFQLVINGVGGNLVAVQASRMSTDMHSRGSVGMLPHNIRLCLSPCDIFFDSKQTNHASTARVLLLMVIPGHLIFSYTISYLEAGHTSFTPVFMLVYLTAALLQVFLLLYIAHIMIVWMWKSGIDPDNSAIPYLTGLGDLLGALLLGVAFHLLFLIGDRDTDVGD